MRQRTTTTSTSTSLNYNYGRQVERQTSFERKQFETPSKESRPYLDILNDSIVFNMFRAFNVLNMLEVLNVHCLKQLSKSFELSYNT